MDSPQLPCVERHLSALETKRTPTNELCSPLSKNVSNNETQLSNQLLESVLPKTPIAGLVSPTGNHALIKHAPPSPEPDPIRLPPMSIELPRPITETEIFDESHLQSDSIPRYGRAVFSPGDVSVYTSVLTPPAEGEDPVTLSRPDTLPGFATSSVEGASSSNSEAHGISVMHTSSQESNSSSTAVEPLVLSQTQVQNHANWDWLAPVVSAIASSVASSDLKGRLRVLSQAFPVPTPNGHFFGEIIQRLQQTLRPTAPVVSLTYAVPSKFKMSDLPGSSATTPRDDNSEWYFASHVIASAVLSRDYGSDEKQDAVPPMVVPSSLHLAIVERFIPPSSEKEVHDTINPQANVLLVERLRELSTKNGCLLFLYPTSAGAETFKIKYLGNCLDPILRAMMVRYNLTDNFCSTVNKMQAVGAIPSYGELCLKMESLCSMLNTEENKTADSRVVESAQYAVAHTSRAEVPFSLQKLIKWWISQEKPRVKREIQQYVKSPRRTARIHGPDDIHPSALVQEVMESLMKKAESLESEARIELGVFVIRKSRRRGEA